VDVEGVEELRDGLTAPAPGHLVTQNHILSAGTIHNLHSVTTHKRSKCIKFSENAIIRYKKKKTKYSWRCQWASRRQSVLARHTEAYFCNNSNMCYNFRPLPHSALGAKGLCGLEAPPFLKVQNAKNCFWFYRTGFHAFDRSHCSERSGSNFANN
jgi:hypothetical protein